VSRINRRVYDIFRSINGRIILERVQRVLSGLDLLPEFESHPVTNISYGVFKVFQKHANGFKELC